MTSPIDYVDVKPGFMKDAALQIDAAQKLMRTKIDTLTSDLNDVSHNMAGSDENGRIWATYYDNAVNGTPGDATSFGALGMMVFLGNCMIKLRDLIDASAVNHKNVEYSGTPTTTFTQTPLSNGLEGPGMPITTYTPNNILVYSPDRIAARQIPSVYGGPGNPSDWQKIQAYVRTAYPDGHTDNLRRASNSWTNIEMIQDVKDCINSAKELLGNSISYEIPLALKWCDKINNALDDLANAANEISQNCYKFATLIDNTRSKVNEILSTITWTIAITQFIGIGLSLITEGGSELAATTYDVYRIAKTGKEVEEVLEIASVSEVTADGAITTLGSDSAELSPLGESSANDGAGLSKAPESKNPLNRFALNKEGKQDVLDNTEKVNIGGKEYYESGANGKIKIPVDGKYPEDSPILDYKTVKDANGIPRYYRDDETGDLFPVEPKGEFGHIFDREFWRVRQQANEEGWSPEEWKNFQKDPANYQYEDQYGNRSHYYENKTPYTKPNPDLTPQSVKNRNNGGGG